MDSVSDRALQSRRRAQSSTPTPTATPPAAQRLESLGVAYQVVRGAGISEDLALLLAYEKGAELIVAVGHAFQPDRVPRSANRAGMSSTFVTRLKVGEILDRREGRLAPRLEPQSA